MTDHELEIVKIAITGEVGKLVAVANERIDAKNAEIASLRSRLAEAEKVIDGIAAAVTFNIGYPYIQLHDAKSFITAYRAKYPKGGGDE